MLLTAFLLDRSPAANNQQSMASNHISRRNATGNLLGKAPIAEEFFSQGVNMEVGPIAFTLIP